MEKGYRNIGFVFLLLIPLTFLGFYKSYFVLSPEFVGTVDTYTHIHAFVEGKSDAALAASVFHFGEIQILELKQELKNNNIPVRL